MTRPARTLARYGLPDTDAVRADLAAAGLVGTDAIEDQGVLQALSRTGRPELAARTLAALVLALGGGPGSQEGGGEATELLAALRAEPVFRGRLLGLLGGSVTLGEHLAAHPQHWRLLAREAGEDVLIAGPSLATELTGPRAVAALRTAYRTRLMMIAASDLAPAVEADLPAPGLDAVCRALSALADELLQAALQVATAELPRAAAPARLAVIAMGKCGANELNYLSDVDVIFVADRPADTADAAERAAEPAAERATELAAEPAAETAVLATATASATRLMAICTQAAWEVDAGLRPEGRTGPLVRTVTAHAAYYHRWAKTWEFQALLKARFAAGDAALGREFLAITAPGVWSAAGRESFVADVQAMRRRVEEAVPAADRDRELKLGAGGLRDVEFAVQLLQLVHGRVDETLRVPGTLEALAALTVGGYVGRRDGAEMAAAYAFLRRVEHLLQLQRLRRTHSLPAGHADLEWLARTDGYTGSGTGDAAAALAADLSRHASTIRRLHEKLFYRPLLAAVAAVPTEELRLSPQAAESRLAALGFAAPEPALRHIAALTGGMSRRAAIQRTLLPVLLGTFADSPDPDGGLLSYRQVSDALAGTPWYLRLLRDEGLIAQRLARLLGGSRLVGDLLQRAPEVLRLLVDDDALIGVTPAEAAAALLARSARADEAVGAAAAARSARRHEMLRLACADMLGLADTVTVTDGLTSIANAAIQAAYAAAYRQVADERGGNAGRLAVIGMGRLGGAELGYSSDADVLFVAGGVPGADPQQAIADATAVAELLTRLLGRTSPDPPLQIDADLRPDGRKGPLVRTVASYAGYWERYAQPWERQALLRARPVAGDAELAAEFLAAADPFRYPADALSAADVREIRRIKARVDTERLPRGADPTLHTKLGRGALADVEWTIQLLQLRHAGALPELRRTGTLPAIRAATDAGLIGDGDAAALAEGWTAATRARNAIMLVTGRAGDEIPEHGRVLAGVARACGEPAGADPGGFVDGYRRATRRARRVVDRLFDQD